MLRRRGHLPEFSSTEGKKLVSPKEAGAALTKDLRTVAIASRVAITAQTSNHGHSSRVQKRDPGYAQVQPGTAQRELPCQLLRTADLRADLGHVRH